ncbi:TPA: glycosyltransferase, partial [Streptococcus suis]
MDNGKLENLNLRGKYMSDVAVSVICTSYNYQNFIAEALQSFVDQITNFPFEIIIVDDCSTDQSMEIIRNYESRYPDLFRVFQNSKNKGLTLTWIDICKEARGKYIARCDADDYWHDPLKLQKQFDALEASPDSVWSNTDFNIVDENGNILHENVFVNGPIKNANTYEKMLVTKGMTLPSSWMIETKLMQEVNEQIDPTSMDDGYPMQLEFFNRTTLLTLPEATVSYRMTLNSDSRPKNTEKALKRFDSILSNQLESIEKYPNKDFKLISK